MSPSLSSVVLIVLAFLLLFGIALFVWGVRGRRVGSEPHCRKCGYNLTGLLSEHCPECGADITDANVVIGRRQRRRPPLIAGLLLLIIATTGLGLAGYNQAKNINWYTYLPTFVLIHEAQADNRSAIAELASRCGAGTVDPQRLVHLIPLALTRQGAMPRPRSAWAWTDLLAPVDGAGLLSKPQQERFYDQVASFRIEFRPRVRRGERVVFYLWHWTYGSPTLKVTYGFGPGELRIGTWQREYHYLGEDSLSTRGGGGSSGHSVETNQFEPGVYQVEFRGTKKFLCGANMDWDDPSFTRDIALTYELEILPADAPDTVRLVDDPMLADDFKQAISIKLTDKPWGGTAKAGMFCLEIAVIRDLPTDVAFRVIGRVGEHEVDLGQFTCKKPGRGYRTQRSCEAQSIGADSFVPILRTSVEAARETTDIFEIWDGELEYAPVQVPPAGE